MGAKRKLDYDCPIRDVLDRVGDAWSVLTILELSKGPCRFNALKRVIDGISQRMLAVTLRNLERDGLVSRQVLPTAPPQVEYALTDRGHSLHGAIGALNAWAVEHQPGIRRDRSHYDQRPKLV
ncbi:putative HTH-type transcriptional regulator YybR [Phaeobacter sp. CECT 5382]|uniref:winged helix-turn-helix transcriptional regulator n=2 Tax=Rhodobacterales TaxID=204455 RepID=UPI0006DB41F5|nr:helix-turn-helix domain-containing protein [Phaeobacter sp. CECT 5382]CUH88279.1 putative HTH-type transcriptional regulator YybR [Phaeobacter sp. CECT 5382]